MLKNSRIISVKELLDKLSTQNSGSFKLFIGQRTFAWNKIKVTNLVDSLLRGFPIGSMLVDEGKEYFSISQRKQARELEEGQIRERIIDGQQRCVSIQSSYTKNGLYNKKSGKMELLWINVLTKNEAVKEFDEEKGQKYILHWSASTKDLNKLNEKERKAEYKTRQPKIGWFKFDKLVSLVRKEEEHTKRIKGKKRLIIKNVRKILLNILEDNEESKSDQIDNIIKDIYHSLFRESIPIHYLQEDNDDVYDLHHIFIRINTGGVQLGPVDVFFAGVKKYWPDAEQYLNFIVNDQSIFSRKSAITILARCAGKSLEEKPFDPYKMGLKQIIHNTIPNAEKGKQYPLINRMRKLTKTKNTKFVKSVKWVTSVSRGHLFSASNHINQDIIMPVIAWAYQYLCYYKNLPDKERKSKFIKPIIKYLFWAQILGSRQYGRSKFDRLCFDYAWEAGKHGEIFPWQDSDLQECCFDYVNIHRKVPEKPRINSLTHEDKDGSAERIRNLMYWNRHLFLSIYQEIPHDVTDIDWDHLIAYNYARSRFKDGRKVIVKYMKWINQIGNFSGIDSSVNRMLQDKGPHYKFDNDKFDYRNKKFVKTNPKLDNNEINKCLSVESYFNKGDKHKAAMKIKDFSCKRSKKIWDNVLQKFGEPPRINAEY